MELQFQRPDPKEDEFASVLLKPGDSIDDSTAMFDAINFSGGVKRALMSLSVGMQIYTHVLLLTALPFFSHSLFPPCYSLVFTCTSVTLRSSCILKCYFITILMHHDLLCERWIWLCVCAPSLCIGSASVLYAVYSLHVAIQFYLSTHPMLMLISRGLILEYRTKPWIKFLSN